MRCGTVCSEARMRARHYRVLRSLGLGNDANGLQADDNARPVGIHEKRRACERGSRARLGWKRDQDGSCSGLVANDEVNRQTIVQQSFAFGKREFPGHASFNVSLRLGLHPNGLCDQIVAGDARRTQIEDVATFDR